MTTVDLMTYEQLDQYLWSMCALISMLISFILPFNKTHAIITKAIRFKLWLFRNIAQPNLQLHNFTFNCLLIGNHLNFKLVSFVCNLLSVEFDLSTFHAIDIYESPSFQSWILEIRFASLSITFLLYWSFIHNPSKSVHLLLYLSWLILLSYDVPKSFWFDHWFYSVFDLPP